MSASRCWSPACAARSCGAACKVRPFKPQNMSNNAAVTADGGEIGRAQALQARAARIAPATRHEPGAAEAANRRRRRRSCVEGKRLRARVTARAIPGDEARSSCRALLDGFRARSRRDADIVLVEGAGSPAEINLRAGDIANMGFAARAPTCPWCWSATSTAAASSPRSSARIALLEPDERALLKGFIVNKFRGDPRLFDAGARHDIARAPAWRASGIVPWFAARDATPGRRFASCSTARPSPRARERCASHRRAAPAAHRQFRRPRSARGRARRRRSMLVAPGARAAAIATSCCCRARRRRAPISRPCGARAGTSTSWHMRGAAAMSSASAAATRCSAARIADPRGIEGPPGAARGSASSMSRPCSTADKLLVAAAGTDLAQRRAGCAATRCIIGRTDRSRHASRPMLRLERAHRRRGLGRWPHRRLPSARALRERRLPPRTFSRGSAPQADPALE